MPANSLTDIQQILFIRPGGIGDAVLLIPAIQVLRLRYPHAKIEVLAEKRNAVIFELCPQVDKIFCYDRWRDWKRLFCSSYDLIIDTEQWHYLSAVIARLLRAPVRLGFATNARSKLFTHPVSYSHDDYEVFSFYHLLHPLGTVCSRELNSPFLTVPEAVKSATELLDSVSEGYVVLFPGASIQERRWGERKFVALAEKIAALGFPLVIVGGDDDLTVGEAVEKNVVSAKNMAGKTSLLETASILRGATLLISGDSGVLHMAVGLGIRTVSLFGPGIAKKWAPSGHRHTVINHHLPCSPCTRFGTTPPCPIGAKCLQDMTVDEVFTAAETLLHSHA
ncbi:lipopolysaccharide heptosyltransferase II [Desulfuromusa kysingii]|uniref:Lipopolysaccharide heptosyltransferase II n=2 Tax=Desulfuromusa kysingii TaxID=37625 RepID=A0A1H4CXU0_9BACT|nr:lipopolysaccharide heptosyltransferase II [Desulfuromusa kysingii]